MKKYLLIFIVFLMINSFSVTAIEGCQDSDNGKDYYTPGSVTKGSDTYKDYCGAEQTGGSQYMFEQYCDASGLVKQDTFICPTGCDIGPHGACINASEPCVDSDGGIDYSNKGTITKGKLVFDDYCALGKLAELYCDENGNKKQEVRICSCSNGACPGYVDPPNVCTDSDNGLDYFTASKATKGVQSLSDGCGVGNNLFEAYCDVNGNLQSSLYVCPNGCKDGACVGSTAQVPQLCTDSDKGDNPNIKGHLIINGKEIYGEDFCYDSSSGYYGYVGESFCVNNGTGTSTSNPRKCQNGCKDGACLLTSTPPMPTKCPTYPIPDCKEGFILKTKTDANGCLNYYCEAPTPIVAYCTDSDNGKNVFVKGITTWKVENNFNQESDFCISEKTVSEGYCDFTDTVKPYRRVPIECSNRCENGVCLETETRSEQVACSFKGSTSIQECYSGVSIDTLVACAGVDTCVVTIQGVKGEKITWKSSCGGYAYTEIDGDDETVTFYCETPKCYPGCTCDKEGNIVSCQSTPTCPEGYSCYDDLSYAYTDYQCPNGYEDGACIPFFKEDDELKTEIEKEYSSSKGCPEKECNELSSNCLKNDKIVTEECTFYLKSKNNECEEITNTNSRVLKGGCEEEQKNKIIMFCQGCQLDDSTCIPFGTRLEKTDSAYYCGITKKMTLQKENKASCQNSYECLSNNCKSGSCKPICEGCLNEDKACVPVGNRTSSHYCDSDYSFKDQNPEENNCNNNYECSSNLCVSNKCVSPSLIQKIIEWFKKLFG